MKKSILTRALLAVVALSVIFGCISCTPTEKEKEEVKEIAPDPVKGDVVLENLSVDYVCGSEERHMSEKLTDAGKKAVETGREALLKMITEEAGISYDQMVESQLSYGNSARTAEVIRKSINGEKITIGILGDSIPSGAGSSEQSKSLGGQIFDFWNECFHPLGKEGNAEYVNGSIGSNSLLNVCHRMDDDLLAHNPDIVIMTAWCTHDNVFDKAAYESMIVRILESGSALICAIVCDTNGNNNTALFREITEAYNVPFVSWAEAYEKGGFKWSEFGSDSIHPNDRGHAAIASSVCMYLLGVSENLPEISTIEAEFPGDEVTKYGRLFTNATVYDRNDDDKFTVETGNFGNIDYQMSSFRTYSGWFSKEKGDKIVFTVSNIKSLMLLLGHDTTTGTCSFTIEDVETGKRLGSGQVDCASTYAYSWNTGVTRNLEGKTVKVTVKAIGGTLVCGLMVTPDNQ